MPKDNKAELLLLDDVNELGRSGDIVSVKRGFARNYLLPKRKAVVADANAKRMQARLQEERQVKAQEDLKHSNELKVKIEALTLKIDVKVDPEGHMYGSIASQDVLNLLSEEGLEVERKSIQLPKPIKTPGAHDLSLKLKEGVMATLKLQVVPEGTTLEELATITAPVEEKQISEKEENKQDQESDS